MEIDKDYNLQVGLRIREIRETMQISRECFSEKCDISPSFLAAVERGEKSITAKTLFKICTNCHVSADYIIKGHEMGYSKDIFLELMNSFSDQQIEHIAKIIIEIQKLNEL